MMKWLVGGGAFLVLCAVAFFAGRVTTPGEDAATIATIEAPRVVRDGANRVLRASVLSHLSGSERLLLELTNAEVNGTVDIEAERDWAQTLLIANRLYRYAAERAGQHRIVQVLEDMEPLLLALANGENGATSEELRALTNTIESKDLLFKVRATQAALSNSAQEEEVGT